MLLIKGLPLTIFESHSFEIISLTLILHYFLIYSSQARLSMSILHHWRGYAKVGLTGSPQKLNMRGIQQHGRKWRVQKRTRGHLRKWTYDSLPEAQRKRDKLFG